MKVTSVVKITSKKDKYNFSFNGFFWGILPVKKKRLILVKQRICQKLIFIPKSMECFRRDKKKTTEVAFFLLTYKK
ncbi:hypothetical protein HMPREF0693_0919 [Proteus mirabilis ATCC 29906]|nr:hypothetical protein HMPREF0693_0919 [Proteus mirabilis ATCC 29906]